MANYRKLGRKTSHRNLMLRNLTTDVLKYGKITTTVTRRMVEKMITLGKKGDLSARRAALAYITDEAVVAKLFSEVAPKYQERNGGYTRVIKLGERRGDSAPMSILELV